MELSKIKSPSCDQITVQLDRYLEEMKHSIESISLGHLHNNIHHPPDPSTHKENLYPTINSYNGSDDLGYEGSSLGSNYSPYNTNHRQGESFNTDSDAELNLVGTNGSLWTQGADEDLRRRTLTESTHEVLDHDDANSSSAAGCCSDESLALKFRPLKFNLQYLEKEEFIGREWVFQKIHQVLESVSPKGVIIVRRTTTGKSAIVNHILKHSQFGEQIKHSLNSSDLSNQSTPTEQAPNVTAGEQQRRRGSCQPQTLYGPEEASLQKRRMLLTPQLQRRRIQPFMTPTVSRKQTTGPKALFHSGQDSSKGTAPKVSNLNNVIYNAPTSAALGKSPESMVRRKTMLSSSMSFRRISPPKSLDPPERPDGGHVKTPPGSPPNPALAQGSIAKSPSTEDALSIVGSRVLAYHVCQSDDVSTRSVPEFVCNMVHQLSVTASTTREVPGNLALMSYKNPVETFYHHFLQPLLNMRKARQIDLRSYVIMVDGLEDCQSSPHTNNLYNFVVYSILPIVPSWIKVILTSRSGSPASGENPLLKPDSITSRLSGEDYLAIGLDYEDAGGKERNIQAEKSADETYARVQERDQNDSLQQLMAREDLYRYIAYRIERCPDMVHDNIVGTMATSMSSPLANSPKSLTDDACSVVSADGCSVSSRTTTTRAARVDYERQLQAASLLPKLVDWLVETSHGDVLYVSSLVDLLQGGELVVKNASFKILPRRLDEILTLRFNRAFPTTASFDRVKPALEVLLAAYATAKPLARTSAEAALQSWFNERALAPNNDKSSPDSDDEVCWDAEFSILEEDGPLDNDAKSVTLDPREMIDLLLKHNFVCLEESQVETEAISFQHPHLGQWLLSKSHDGNKYTKDTFGCSSTNGHAILGNYYASLSLCDSSDDNITMAAKHLALANHQAVNAELSANFQLAFTPQQMTDALTKPSNVYRPDLETSQFLLKSGADANAKLAFERDSPTLLITAARGPEYSAFVDLLLESGADPNLCDARGANCAIHAARNGNATLLKRLIQTHHNLDVTHCDEEGKSALLYAVENNHCDAISLIVHSLKAQIQSSDVIRIRIYVKQLERSFFTAATKGNIPVCREIQKKFPKFDIVNSVDEETGLSVLCASILNYCNKEAKDKLDFNRNELIRYLITEGGADVRKGCYQKSHQTCTKKGGNLVTNCTSCKNLDICECPLKSKYTNPLLGAAEKGNFDAVQLLVKQLKVTSSNAAKLNMFLDQMDNHGHCALMLAANVGAFEVLEVLISEGANIALLDLIGRSVLHLACKNGNEHIVSRLIHKAPFLVNILDKDGLTPLHFAAARGFKNVVQVLIDGGNAHMNVLDNEGLSPMDMAVKAYTALPHTDPSQSADQDGRQYLATVVIFLKRGAKIRSSVWKFLESSIGPSHTPTLLMYMLFFDKLSQDGHFLSKNDKPEEAIYRYEYAIKHFPTIDPQKVSNPKGPADMESLDLLKSFTELRGHLLINLSRCKLNQRDFNGAIEYATKALEVKPNFFEAYYLRAKANKYNNQLIPALKDIIEAQEIQPENGQYKALLSNLKESIVSNSTVIVN